MQTGSVSDGVRWARVRSLPVLVVVVGMIATILGALAINATNESRARERFERAVDEANDAIEGRLETYVAVLRAGAGLFVASDAVDRAEFHAFAERVEVAMRYPGIQGIGYSARIPAGREAATIANLRSLGAQEINPPDADAHEEAHRIAYLEPEDLRNTVALGFDMHAHPVRREAMDRARDTGATAMSGKVVLIQEIDAVRQSGFLIYEPIYDGGKIPGTVAERREKLVGHIFAPFRAGDLLRNVMRGAGSTHVDYAVYDGTPSAERLLYSEGAPDRGVRYEARRELSVGGRPWTVIYRAEAGFHPMADRALVLVFLVLGGLASILGAWATESQVRARLVAEREIESRAMGEERRKLLLDELNHRVKNTLATVQSIAAQSLRNAPDLESGRRDFTARLMALSEAHNLLTRDDWRGASLADLAANELEPYGGEGWPQRVTILGEPVWLRPNTAVALGMAFHELATNAAKYGALSGKRGQVRVSWEVSRTETGPDRVSITWREAGGPTVRPPARQGFGSRLIVAGLAHQLKGDVQLEFEPDGVRCQIAFNLADDEGGAEAA